MGNCENFYVQVGDRQLILWLHTRQSPSDEEWERAMALTRSIGFEGLAYLVLTDGGGPTTTQRARLQAVVGGKDVPIAVVTDDRLTRGIVTAIRWFNPRIKAFSTKDFSGALLHLGLDPSEHGAGLLDRFEIMQQKLETVGTLALMAQRYRDAEGQRRKAGGAA